MYSWMILHSISVLKIRAKAESITTRLTSQVRISVTISHNYFMCIYDVWTYIIISTHPKCCRPICHICNGELMVRSMSRVDHISPLSRLHWLKASEHIAYRVDVLAYNINMVWRQRTCVTNYVDQQTLKPDDVYVQPHQRLWMFDVLVCPLSATERFPLQSLDCFPLVCVTVFHRTSLLPTLSPSSAIVLNHISSHFLIPLPYSSLICTVPAQWLLILDTMITVLLLHLHVNDAHIVVYACVWRAFLRSAATTVEHLSFRADHDVSNVDLEPWQHRTRPVLHHSVQAQVLTRQLHRHGGRADQSVHVVGSQARHDVRDQNCRYQRFRSESAIRDSRLHHTHKIRYATEVNYIAKYRR